MFDYWTTSPDERSYWQSKVTSAAANRIEADEIVRTLERELWIYFKERADHVPSLQRLNVDGSQRVSFRNLAEYLLRLWAAPATFKSKIQDQDLIA